MLKKLGIVALIVVAGFLVLRMTKVGSYAGTAWSKIRAGANNQVPVEFEIERIRHEVGQLVPDMKKHLNMIAQEMVAIDNLREEITVARANLEGQKLAVAQMAQDLKDPKAQRIEYRGQQYSRARVGEKLARDVASCKRCEAELKSKEQLLEAKERALEAAREQVAAIKDQKRELEVQIAKLEAEVQNVRLAQSKSKFQFDDSRLTEIKRSLADVQNRLKIESKTLELEGQFANDPTVHVEKQTRSVNDVVREADEYLNGDKPDTKVAERK